MQVRKVVGHLVGSCNQHKPIDVAKKRKKLNFTQKRASGSLTCSLMMLGSNGSSQKADVDASDEQRQHLRASTGND